MQLYAMHDGKPEAKPFKVNEDEARALNARGYGIFWTPNEFKGRRKVQNLTKINYWFVETDKLDKDAVLAKFEDAPIPPTMIVESKNGIHAYWKAKDATSEGWDEVVKRRLVPAFGGDRKSSDVSRLLRAPGFYHQKNPSSPFLVRTLFEEKLVGFRQDELLKAYAREEDPVIPAATAPRGNSFWKRVSELDCRDAIRKFSGHWLCKGERFVLDEQANGNANIIRIDEEYARYSTGCFVDRYGRLGCVEGGSSIAAWLHWYGWTWGEVSKGLVEVYPELDK